MGINKSSGLSWSCVSLRVCVLRPPYHVLLLVRPSVRHPLLRSNLRHLSSLRLSFVFLFFWSASPTVCDPALSVHHACGGAAPRASRHSRRCPLAVHTCVCVGVCAASKGGCALSFSHAVLVLWWVCPASVQPICVRLMRPPPLPSTDLLSEWCVPAPLSAARCVCRAGVCCAAAGGWLHHSAAVQCAPVPPRRAARCRVRRHHSGVGWVRRALRWKDGINSLFLSPFAFAFAFRYHAPPFSFVVFRPLIVFQLPSPISHPPHSACAVYCSFTPPPLPVPCRGRESDGLSFGRSTVSLRCTTGCLLTQPNSASSSVACAGCFVCVWSARFFFLLAPPLQLARICCCCSSLCLSGCCVAIAFHHPPIVFRLCATLSSSCVSVLARLSAARLLAVIFLSKTKT